MKFHIVTIFFWLNSEDMEISGPGIEPTPHCDLCHSCSNTGFLTHYAIVGTLILTIFRCTSQVMKQFTLLCKHPSPELFHLTKLKLSPINTNSPSPLPQPLPHIVLSVCGSDTFHCVDGHCSASLFIHQWTGVTSTLISHVKILWNNFRKSYESKVIY